MAVLTLMLCLTINYRAFSELSGESAENRTLEQRIQSVTTNNLSLQEQIHYLKNDPETVARESRKFGFRRAAKDKEVLPPRHQVKKQPDATSPKQGVE